MCSPSWLPLPDTPPLPPDAPETPPTPPTPLNPHVLVAFAAQHLSKSSGTPETTHYSRYYIPPYDKPRILDAIAALCVTSENPQPVAAALTIDSMDRQVRLLISQAGVDRIDERLLGHINKTWGLLRTLSEHYHTQGPVTWRQHSRKPGEMAHVAPLFRYVYEFHHAEVLRTFREWWPKLDAADRQLGRSRRYEEIRRPTEGLMGHFNTVARALRIAVSTMGDDLLILSDKHWRHLLLVLDFAAYYTKPLLRQWGQCQDWGFGFENGSNSGPPPAHAALTHLTALQTHLCTLTSFAAFARPAEIFTYTLHTSFVPCLPRPTPLPSDWAPTLTDYFTNPHKSRSLAAWTVSKTAELAKAYHPPPATTAASAPHPECALVAYLHKHRTVPPPLGYIGLSHPPCAACALWLDAYHARPHARRYKHQATLHAWSWPWALPLGATAAEEAVLVEKVHARCTGYLNWAGLFDYWDDWEVNEGEGRKLIALSDKFWGRTRNQKCLWGCIGVEECACLSVLWGEV